MEKYIDALAGEFNSKHVKQGIIVRKNQTREFIGIVVCSSKGYAIRTPSDEYLGGKGTVNGLMIWFMSSYSFYIL